MLGLISLALAGSARFDQLESAEGWSELGSKNSTYGRISVRSRSIEGATCYEGVLHASVPVGSLVDVTSTMVRAPEWSSAKLLASEELERSGSSFVLFQVLDVPGWTLAADRYWVLRGRNTWGSDGSASYRYERTDPTAWPRVAEVLGTLSGTPIEPPTNYGRWTFTPAGGQTQVEYRSCAVFGGVVPAAIQSWIALQQLPATMEDLVREAGRR